MIKLTISTSDPMLKSDLLSDSPRASQLNLQLFHLQSSRIEIKQFTTEELLMLGLTWAGSITCGIMANYLYDKLKDRAKTLKINDKVTAINPDDISRGLQEAVEQIDCDQKLSTEQTVCLIKEGIPPSG